LKILLISFDFPYPPSGGSISRDYNLIKQLSKNNDIFWINRTIRDRPKDEYIKEMEKYCKIIKIVEWNYGHTIIGLIKSFFTKEPYIIHRFASQYMTDLVHQVLKNNIFDLILCDHIYLSQYLPHEIELHVPTIPNNEDNGFTYYKRLSETNGLIRPFFAKLQWRKMLNYEVNVYQRFCVDITTSDTEKNIIMKYLKGVKIGVVKNGVDVDYFKPMKRTNMENNIIYTAWFKYYPNQQAVIEFVKDVFPLLKAKIPDIKFYIVGKEPPKRVHELSKINGIVVTGEVEDVRPYLANADVAVIPLKVGGGTRLKILEAMAMGIPVISTKLGAEGLDVKEDENILIADDHEDFAQKIYEIITDKQLSKRISDSAIKFVEENYTWEKIGEDICNFINDFVYTFKN
jgi:sugar transferase (PEP-CTERM/EpsH1 system associated)